MDYFVMARAPNETGQVAQIDDHPDDLPIKGYKFRKGIALKVLLNEPLIYTFSNETPKGRRLIDLQPNSEGLFIVSPKLKAVFEGQSNIEFIRIRLLDHRGNVASEDYHLANVLDPLDCIDLKQSEYRLDKLDPSEFNRINKLVLDPLRIPKNIHIFRLKQAPNTVVLDATLAKPILDQKLVGPQLVPIAEFDSPHFLGV